MQYDDDDDDDDVDDDVDDDDKVYAGEGYLTLDMMDDGLWMRIVIDKL